MRVFDNGNHVHSRLMSILYRSSDIRVVAGEIKIPDNPKILGTCDAIVGIDEENFILDFKSINSRGFSYLDEEKPDHKVQLLLYLFYFKIRKGYIIYENKDDQSLKEFLVDSETPENKELISQIFAKLDKLGIYIKEHALPDKPKDLESWRCTYCDFKEECSKNFNGDSK